MNTTIQTQTRNEIITDRKIPASTTTATATANDATITITNANDATTITITAIVLDSLYHSTSVLQV